MSRHHGVRVLTLSPFSVHALSPFSVHASMRQASHASGVRRQASHASGVRRPTLQASGVRRQASGVRRQASGVPRFRRQASGSFSHFSRRPIAVMTGNEGGIFPYATAPRFAPVEPYSMG